MKDKYHSLVTKIMIFIIDFWLINMAFTFTGYLGIAQSHNQVERTSFFLIFTLLWIIAGSFFKIHRINGVSLVRSISVNLFSAFLVHMLMIHTILISFKIYSVSNKFLVYAYVFSILLIIPARLLYKLILKYLEFSRFDQRNVIIIGATNTGRSLYQFFATHEGAGYRFKGFFDDTMEETGNDKRLLAGKLDVIKDFCRREHIDEIYFALPLTYKELLEDIMKFADDNCIYFRIAPDFSKIVYGNGNVFMVNSVPVLIPRKEPLGVSVNATLKRVFDIAFSLVVIVTVFPVVFPVIALAIRLDSPGPIIFKQLRPGKKNKLFDCYKFRTMRINATPEMQATKDDSRITSVGRFLRKTNLDELPQFFNVLLGNMSVVGPRPNMVSQLEHYSKTIDHYKVRHFITPGITGYAQVNGFRGETKDHELMRKRVEYDVLYLENWSLLLDIKIIFQTVWNMIRGDRNAY